MTATIAPPPGTLRAASQMWVLALLVVSGAGAASPRDTYLDAFSSSQSSGLPGRAPPAGVVSSEPEPDPDPTTHGHSRPHNPALGYGMPSTTYGSLPSSAYGAPSSAYGAPSSAYGAPSSAYGTPSSAYGTPSSAYGPPSSAYGPPSSAYGPPSTTYGTLHSSAYGAPSKTYGTPSSAYGTPSTTYGAPSSVYGAPSPAYMAPSSSGVYGPPLAGYPDHHVTSTHVHHHATGMETPDRGLHSVPIHLVLKILLKVLIFKLIVKFIAVICVLLFLPTFHLKDDKGGDDASSRGVSSERLDALTALVLSGIGGKEAAVDGSGDECGDSVACRLATLARTVDDHYTIYRLVDIFFDHVEDPPVAS